MNYNELIKDYHSKGFGTEKKMWESIYVLEDAMMCLKEKNPDVHKTSTEPECFVGVF